MITSEALGGCWFFHLFTFFVQAKYFNAAKLTKEMKYNCISIWLSFFFCLLWICGLFYWKDNKKNFGKSLARRIKKNKRTKKPRRWKYFILQRNIFVIFNYISDISRIFFVFIFNPCQFIWIFKRMFRAFEENFHPVIFSEFTFLHECLK